MNLETLLKLGATVCAGAIDIEHVHVANLDRDGNVALTEGGKAKLGEISDPVVKADSKPSKAKKVAAPAAEAQEPAAE